jgi:uncharacterized protein (DUF433 family)
MCIWKQVDVLSEIWYTRERSMNGGRRWTSYSSALRSMPIIAFGKSTIRGLRYSVEWLLELLSSGMSQQAILEDYEDLELADIYAVLAYATKPSQVKRIVVVLLNFRRIRNGLYL